MKTVLRVSIAAIVLAVAFFFLFAGTLADRSMNTVTSFGPYTVSDEGRNLAAESFVSDLHADPLLWDRDLLAHNDHGQVDLPRLLDGDVAFQVFGIVTKSPVGQNFDANPSNTDQLIPLVMASGYPVEAWFGDGALTARALYQAQKLHEFAASSDDRLRVIKSKQDMQDLVAARAAGKAITGGLLGLEGMQPIENNLATLDQLFAGGIRMGGLAHFFDNEVAGSAHGMEKHGLTELGRATVKRMEELQIIVDLAHTAPAAIDDTLQMATRPVVVSHTGVKGTCGGNRNLSDDQLLRLKENGALIGIGYFDGAVCGTSPQHIVDAIMYTINLIGVAHVALGSDFDGTVHTDFDTSGVALIADELRNRGLSDDHVAQVMGLNAQRFFLANLPD